ncbi:bifunctional 3'-5' exonuclease/DNA polymerase [Microbacterium sp. CFH 31415]|uniref:bifunctional 3'-5' exonuclease/DNA polymerase n=1 Tax=Microbacterium sp. CFH 31415 TaxID=2921732 RepID=UPI001F13BE5C|nr:bifunctional 3'-5' exonuclease/DNA polymerase [Microbacterium sp. CFH 31415]MCH6229665.1 bifunctional 3'-5' exonuclease/DNA polymerase [Microbacterium sp. CFH 31415]
MPRPDAPAWIVLGHADGGAVAALLDAGGAETGRRALTSSELPGWVAEREAADAPRWVWNDAPQWYGPLLRAGVRVGRCHDLRLCHAILRSSSLVVRGAMRGPGGWDAAPFVAVADSAPALFDLERAERPAGPPDALDEALAEFARQRDAVASSADPSRLRLLLAAESAGALIAEELRAAGLPWDAAAHDGILIDLLGERPAGGGQPAKLAAAAARVRDALGDPAASLDSQPKLLRSLHRAGVLVESTSRWELAEHQHPVIAPLLEYKKLARLLSANGWAWLDEWVADGRFRPVFVPGGVVTGRWASSGGGALQLPRQLREAVRADPGWKLVVADVAQLEPRVLAAMSSDAALAAAARGRDLYAGIVESGAVPSRQQAKIALLGAMYGATTGESGRLMPRLRRAYPRAMGLVDDAARTGEDGGVVSTWLGRSSPSPSEAWAAAQSQATEAEASGADETRARRWARDRGRFTRNFVVQGTAAEWALAWMADLRSRLHAMPPVDADLAAPRSGPVFARRPHLAFFLHDEVIVHAPASLADGVAQAVTDAAAAAGRLLFGDFPVDFRLDVNIADSALKG